ncbi:phospholipase A2 inhibitor gamma subunit B-like [Gopherus flavomarginatus]|uniref:phospholipase A2 inhibitor gamma subunit B-like n=1 Tax=Gopherus flavomarginatus TaxID=286002 RepID=UPI0021CC1924|nr:phospholipase A2 inhibitor gamma subunit B-like [Gopherus flavomarginatus]
MKSSLAICVLAALLVVGASLRCEVCSALGTSCTGELQTCATGQDNCAVGLAEITTGVTKTQSIVKSCMTSTECNAGLISANFGTGLATRMSVACCVGDACSPTPIAVPPADPTPNGRSCPACFPLSSLQCSEETINCTGSDTRCLEVTATVTNGGMTASTTMKGCASESLCAQIKAGAGTLAGVSGDLTLKCKAPGTAPGPAGLLIPAVAGLLLLKVFS